MSKNKTAAEIVRSCDDYVIDVLWELEELGVKNPVSHLKTATVIVIGGYKKRGLSPRQAAREFWKLVHYPKPVP